MKREPNKDLKKDSLPKNKTTKMRKGRAKKRPVIPDPKYGNELVNNQSNDDTNFTEVSGLKAETEKLEYR